jgi:hypothetical protein
VYEDYSARRLRAIRTSGIQWLFANLSALAPDENPLSPQARPPLPQTPFPAGTNLACARACARASVLRRVRRRFGWALIRIARVGGGLGFRQAPRVRAASLGKSVLVSKTSVLSPSLTPSLEMGKGGGVPCGVS